LDKYFSRLENYLKDTKESYNAVIWLDRSGGKEVDQFLRNSSYLLVFCNSMIDDTCDNLHPVLEAVASKRNDIPVGRVKHLSHMQDLYWYKNWIQIDSRKDGGKDDLYMFFVKDRQIYALHDLQKYNDKFQMNTRGILYFVSDGYKDVTPFSIKYTYQLLGFEHSMNDLKRFPQLVLQTQWQHEMISKYLNTDENLFLYCIVRCLFFYLLCPCIAIYNLNIDMIDVIFLYNLFYNLSLPTFDVKLPIDAGAEILKLFTTFQHCDTLHHISMWCMLFVLRLAPQPKQLQHELRWVILLFIWLIVHIVHSYVLNYDFLQLNELLSHNKSILTYCWTLFGVATKFFSYLYAKKLRLEGEDEYMLYYFNTEAAVFMFSDLLSLLVIYLVIGNQ
jgi:hypothetical protein